MTEPHQLDTIDVALADAQDPVRNMTLLLTTSDPVTLAPFVLELQRKAAAFDRIATAYHSGTESVLATAWREIAVMDNVKGE